MAATSDRKDPYQGYRFRLEIDGITYGGFRECSGLDSTQDPVEYRDGTDEPTVRKLAGLVKYSNISLKRGVLDTSELWDWRKGIMEGNIVKNKLRKSGSIILMDDAGDEKRRWNFRNAWPTKWTGPTFNATTNDVALETLDLAHEGLEKAK